MDELLALLQTHRRTLIWISWASAALFVLSLLAIPVLVARAPSDFFVREHKRRAGPGWLLLAVLRNAVGVVLLLAGILMLVLPGQGLLAVLLAVSLLDLPKKHALMRRIVQKPAVWRALEYLRRRAHKPPFERPEAGAPT